MVYQEPASALNPSMTVGRQLIEGGKRRDLAVEEDLAFWAWAAVEVLRLTGVRVEELLEISHHSLVQYRLPATGELVPLLQIIPSKTDTERLLVVSPELADVLSVIIRRIRGDTEAVPLVRAYDRRECLWIGPAPLLFQRRFGADNRRICDSTIRNMLNAALAGTGLTDHADGSPLHYSPHDFRRIFITDAKIGRIASDASFGSWRERALPAAQRAALRCAGRAVAPGVRCDLGFYGLPGSAASMMQLFSLRGVHLRCAC